MGIADSILSGKPPEQTKCAQEVISSKDVVSQSDGEDSTAALSSDKKLAIALTRAVKVSGLPGIIAATVPIRLVSSFSETQNCRVSPREIEISRQFVDQAKVRDIIAVLIHATSHIMFGHCDSKYLRHLPKGLKALVCDFEADRTTNFYYPTFRHEEEPAWQVSLELLGDNLRHSGDKIFSAEQLLDSLLNKYGSVSAIVSALRKLTEKFNDLDDIVEADVSQHERDQMIMTMASAYVTSSGGYQAGKGHSPNVEKIVEELLKPKLDLKQILAEFVTETSGNSDFTWSKPNRNYLWTKCFFPAQHSEQLRGIVAALDTSGSVGPRLQEYFLGLLHDLATQSEEGIRIIKFTGEVYNEMWLSSTDPDPVRTFRKKLESGGTSFEAVFKYLAEHPTPQIDSETSSDSISMANSEMRCLAILTDGYAPNPTTELNVPIIWFINKQGDHGGKPGRVVVFEEADVLES